MLVEPGKAHLIDLSDPALLDQVNEEPEGKRGGAMHDEPAHKETHPLDVPHIFVVAAEGSEYVPEPLSPARSFLEVLIPSECTGDVHLDLIF